MDQEETINTPVPWSGSAMEWRQIISSPFCEMTPTQKHILTVTCRYGKKWGEDIFPSQREIAFRSGASLTYVNETMREVEKRGWLIRQKFPIGNGRCNTLYRLSIPAGVADATASMKYRFWLPPYKYELLRSEDAVTLVKRGVD